MIAALVFVCGCLPPLFVDDDKVWGALTEPDIAEVMFLLLLANGTGCQLRPAYRAVLRARSGLNSRRSVGPAVRRR
jgi:hypothetical protein